MLEATRVELFSFHWFEHVPGAPRGGRRQSGSPGGEDLLHALDGLQGFYPLEGRRASEPVDDPVPTEIADLSRFLQFVEIFFGRVVRLLCLEVTFKSVFRYAALLFISYQP